MFKTWEDAALRIGLIASAALSWYGSTRLWESGNMVVERGALALALLGYFLAALLLFMAVIQPIPRWARLLIPLTLVLLWASLGFVDAVNRDQTGNAFSTDVHLFSDYAADLVRQGQNPYTYDLLDAFRVYRASELYSTPLIDGDITGGMSYPPLAFLIYVPFQALGIDTALIYPLMLLATLLLIWALAPPALRPLAVLPFLVNPDYMLYSLGGVNDIGWALLLCLMIALWRHKSARAILFGLACAYKQQPWFLAPFLLVYLWHDGDAADQPPRTRLIEIARFALIAGASFALVNAPFVIANSGAWLSGVLRPLVENMIVLGQGYSSLSLFGLVFFPDWLFTILTYGLLIALLLLYARYYHQWPEALWMLPAIILWFGHRSLTSYWYYYLFPLAAALLMRYRAALPALEPETQPASRLWLVPVIIGALATLGALVFALVPNPIQISLIGPVLYGGTDTRLTVQVANHSSQPLTPRFSVQSWSQQPFFWEVLDGPSVLEPGQQAVFTLHTDYPPEVFNVSAGAQVIVSDADSYDLRAALFLPSASLIYPDRVPNGDYVYWNPADDVPYGWGFVGDPQTGQVRLVTSEPSPDQPGRALQLSVTPDGDQPTELAVDTWLMLPEAPILLWVDPPAQANQAPAFDPLYGLQIVLTANAKRFYILFGSGAPSGTLPDGDSYALIAAPAGQWTQVTLNLPQIIQALGVPLPDPQIRAVGSLQIPMQMVNFRFYLRASSAAQAEFGPVAMQDGGIGLQDDLIAQTIQSPADLLLWRGDINLQVGSDALARQYYQQAVDADPQSGAAYYGLAAALVKLGDDADVQADVQAALADGYPESARAYAALGSADLALKQYDAAQTAFSTALDRLTSDLVSYDDPFQAGIYNGLGEALLLQGRPEVAEGMFTRASQLDPLDQANDQALLDIYASENRCPAAAALIDQAARYGLTLPSPAACQ